MNVPDHPAIRAIERTGDAEEVEFVHCDECNGEVYKGEKLFIFRDASGNLAYVCEECLLRRFYNLNIAKKAEMMDSTMIVYMGRKRKNDII